MDNVNYLVAPNNAAIAIVVKGHQVTGVHPA